MRSPVLFGLLLLSLAAEARPPVADAHTHYNWDQSELISPSQAVAILDREGVDFAVVSSMPPERALRLRQADPKGRVQVLFSPYITPMHRYSWHVSPAVVTRARAALAGGEYAGIGELHLTPAVRGGRDNPILHRLIALALKYDKPFLLHTESTDPDYLVPLCRRYPALKLVWAHAGGNMPVAGVRRTLEACPNLVADLSARDRWRYVDAPIVDPAGHLLPEWRSLILRWPGRFMIGADALWPVDQKHRWDVADSGWLRVHDFLQFHRRWLRDLPPSVARRVAHDNALRVYGS